MRKGDTYTILFAAAVCVACSILLSATSAALKSRQERQAEIDRKINVLKALGVAVKNEEGKKISGEEVESIFSEHISEVIIDAKTGEVVPGLGSADVSKEEIDKREKLPLYEWRDQGEVTKYVFPISGKGLWSTIYGYLALDSDLGTIAGITFYKHGETPGLGGEISADWFQQQFKGKKIYEDGKLLQFQVVKGKVADKYPKGNDHAVDGISGATLTGKGVTQFMNADLEKYEKYFSRIRKG